MSDRLPEELQHLVAAELDAPVTSAAAQAAVRAKLGRTLGVTGVAAASVASAKAATAATANVTAASTATANVTVASAAAGGVAVKSALAIKLIGVVLSVGAVATTVAVTRDREPTAPAPVVERAPRASATHEPAIQRNPTIRVEPIEEDAPVIAPPPITEPPPSEPAPRATMDPPPRRTKQVEPPPVEAPPPRSQSQLLADASRSLSVGDAAHALELIDEDARAHGAGPLVEERDALRISALSALGRSAEAQEAARRLLATYPNSIHRPLAERVLAKETP